MTADPNKQWRIDNADHLMGVRFRFQRYKAYSETWDHDHCAACMIKLAEFDAPDVRRDGYATCEDYPKGAAYEWLCEDCFTELEDDMGWIAVTA